MKKSLMKTIIIAAMLFSSSFKVKEIYASKREKTKEEFVISSCNANKKINKCRVIPWLSLQTGENLKAYHLGLKFFDSSHKIPTAKDLANSIKLHPFYIGKFTQELTIEECDSIKNRTNYPFFIYETCQDSRSDFYMVHSKDVRHFTIESLNKNIASFCNSTYQNYPDLNKFIKCTLESHANKHLI